MRRLVIVVLAGALLLGLGIWVWPAGDEQPPTVTVAWDPVPDASHYEVAVGTGGVVITATEPQAEVPDERPIRVRACRGNHCSQWSALDKDQP